MANQITLVLCLLVAVCVSQVVSECTDKLKNCDYYGQNGCRNFKPFSVKNCQKYCNYCDEAPCMVNGKLRPGCKTAPVVGCMDKTGINCKSYGQNGCQGIYKGWAKLNCKKFCGFC